MTKLVAARLREQSAGTHLSADLLAALAERALAPREREQALAHLSACADCRRIFYLAAPEAPDAQKILTLKQNRSRLAWRWGAILASVAVVSAVFVVRQEIVRKPAQLAKAPSQTSADDKIVANKVPAQFTEMREAEKAPSAAVAAKSRPEAKHMTAKPQVALNFEPSGQVRVAGPQSSNERDERALGHQSSNGVVLNGNRAAQSLSASQAAGGGLKDQNALANTYAATGLMTPSAPGKALAAGNLGGVVLDGAGAVVANAKVSTTGPSGTKTATSGPDGRFDIDQLSPGQYTVKAEATGFKAAETKQVAVAANQPSTVQLKLEPGAAAETVEVSAASPAGLQAQALDSASLNSVQSARQENMQQESAEVSRKKQRLSKAAAVAGTGPAIALSQWSLSPAGAVQRSSDGGKTWNPVPVVGGQTFRALSAVRTNIWVGGNNAALYHSADSGQHWAQVVPVADGHKLEGDIVHVDFDNAVSGTLRTSSGETWTTVDGGQSWRLK